MISKPYSKYFQKSRSFLLPAIGTVNNMHVRSLSSFIAWEGHYKPEDCRLILVVDKRMPELNTPEFLLYEEHVLKASLLYEKTVLTQTGHAHIYDMTSFERDWGRFLDGRYSQLSPHLKERIRYYYGPNSGEYAYMETFIYPEQFFGVYAFLLDVDEAIIRQVGELCNVYDLDRETYRGLTFGSEVLKKNAVSKADPAAEI
jgi:hypothetical protein